MTPKPLSDRDIYRLSKLYELPEFVKSASSNDLLGTDEDELVFYADPQHKAYYTRTKAATWVSVANFMEQSDNYTVPVRNLIESRLNDAVRYFGLGSDVAELREKYAGTKAVQLDKLPDSYFGYIEKQAGSTAKTRRLRLLNAPEIQKAADWLLQHRDTFTFPDRMKIAKRIIARAREVGTDLPTDALDKIAGYGGATLQSALDAITTRIGLLRIKHASADTISSLSELIVSLHENPDALAHSTRRVKLATLLDQLDRSHELQHAYHRDGLLRPEESLFQMTEKVAHAFLKTYAHAPTGEVYRCADLDKIAVTDLCELVGSDLAEICTSDGIMLDGVKMASELPSLNSSQSSLLSSALAHLGAQPETRASTRSRLDLQKLASSPIASTDSH